MQFEFKVNGEQIFSDQKEIKISKLLEIAAEQGAISKDEEWEIVDEKDVVLDPSSTVDADQNIPFVARPVAASTVATARN